MNLIINGESREFPEPALTLSALILERLGMKADRVAVELNRRIASRGEWESTFVKDGDCLEIVHFVGGGKS
ncbi:MAG TPA: sulfur carrier protein ThiS [Terriglobales bacterium]|jgi:sulfur carrier protein|nr:sulfur carrier protein ThiS [Terriglobales bacterium]